MTSIVARVHEDRPTELPQLDLLRGPRSRRDSIPSVRRALAPGRVAPRNQRSRAADGGARRANARRSPMPSLIHDALVQLFRNRPSLAPDLLRDALHTPVPAFDQVRIGDAALGEIAPTEYRADLVLLLEAESPGGTRPRAALVLEAQLGRDSDKRWSWPVYLAGRRTHPLVHRHADARRVARARGQRRVGGRRDRPGVTGRR